MLVSLALVCAFALPSHDGPHFRHAQGGAPAWHHAPKPEVPVHVGTGKQRYLWNADWLQLPEGRDWLGSTHGCIAIDREDRIYLSADSGPAVLVYSGEGKLLRSMGADWGAGVHGLSLVAQRQADAEGKDLPRIAGGQWPSNDPRWDDYREVLWVAHTAKHEVYQSDLEGNILLRIGWPEASGKYTSADQYHPTSVAVGPDGTIFVADGYGRSWIHRFDATGKYLDSFGGPGDGPEHLNTPHGLWMDWRGESPTLLVADRENHRIARFSLAGKFLEGTDPASGLLRRPCHLQFHGDLGVVADLAGRVTLLGPKLELLAHLGDNPNEAQRAQYQVAPEDWREGAFCAPHCAHLDSRGRIYVMDWNVAGRFTRLEPALESGEGDAK